MNKLFVAFRIGRISLAGMAVNAWGRWRQEDGERKASRGLTTRMRRQLAGACLHFLLSRFRHCCLLFETVSCYVALAGVEFSM